MVRRQRHTLYCAQTVGRARQPVALIAMTVTTATQQPVHLYKVLSEMARRRVCIAIPRPGKRRPLPMDDALRRLRLEGEPRGGITLFRQRAPSGGRSTAPAVRGLPAQQPRMRKPCGARAEEAVLSTGPVAQERHLFITVLAYQLVQVIRRRLRQHCNTKAGPCF